MCVEFLDVDMFHIRIQRVILERSGKILPQTYHHLLVWLTVLLNCRVGYECCVTLKYKHDVERCCFTFVWLI